MKEKETHRIQNSSSKFVHMLNMGGLFLLNESHSQWAAQLISMIENLFSISNLRLYKGMLVGVGWKIVFNDQCAKNKFKEICEKNLSDSQIDLLYHYICRKTFNVYSKQLIALMSKDVLKTKGTFRGDLKANEYNNETRKKRKICATGKK